MQTNNCKPIFANPCISCNCSSKVWIHSFSLCSNCSENVIYVNNHPPETQIIFPLNGNTILSQKDSINIFLSSFTLLHELEIPFDSLFTFTHIQSLNHLYYFCPCINPHCFIFHIWTLTVKCMQGGLGVHKIIFWNSEIKYYNSHSSIFFILPQSDININQVMPYHPSVFQLKD